MDATVAKAMAVNVEGYAKTLFSELKRIAHAHFMHDARLQNACAKLHQTVSQLSGDNGHLHLKRQDVLADIAQALGVDSFDVLQTRCTTNTRNMQTEVIATMDGVVSLHTLLLNERAVPAGPERETFRHIVWIRAAVASLGVLGRELQTLGESLPPLLKPLVQLPALKVSRQYTAAMLAYLSNKLQVIQSAPDSITQIQETGAHAQQAVTTAAQMTTNLILLERGVLAMAPLLGFLRGVAGGVAVRDDIALHRQLEDMGRIVGEGTCHGGDAPFGLLPANSSSLLSKTEDVAVALGDLVTQGLTYLTSLRGNCRPRENGADCTDQLVTILPIIVHRN